MSDKCPQAICRRFPCQGRGHTSKARLAAARRFAAVYSRVAFVFLVIMDFQAVATSLLGAPRNNPNAITHTTAEEINMGLSPNLKVNQVDSVRRNG